MMNCLKKVIPFRVMIPAIYLTKVDYDTKIEETEDKTPDHDKYIE